MTTGAAGSPPGGAVTAGLLRAGGPVQQARVQPLQCRSPEAWASPGAWTQCTQNRTGGGSEGPEAVATDVTAKLGSL